MIKLMMTTLLTTCLILISTATFADAALDQVGGNTPDILNSINVQPAQLAAEQTATQMQEDLLNQRNQNQAYVEQVGQQIVSAGSAGSNTTVTTQPSAPPPQKVLPQTVTPAPTTTTPATPAQNKPAPQGRGWSYGF